MSDDLVNDPEFLAFAGGVIDDLVPKMMESTIVVSLVPKTAADVKYAVELGLSIMMDKPIVAVVHPGVHVPAKLLAVADHVVEGDLTTEEGRDSLQRRLEELVKSY